MRMEADDYAQYTVRSELFAPSSINRLDQTAGATQPLPHPKDDAVSVWLPRYIQGNATDVQSRPLVENGREARCRGTPENPLKVVVSAPNLETFYPSAIWRRDYLWDI